MKKKILAVFLAVVIMLGAVIPAYANTEGSRDRSAEFLELLSPEAAEQLEAVGEGFVDALLRWFFVVLIWGTMPVGMTVEGIADVFYLFEGEYDALIEIFVYEMTAGGFWWTILPSDEIIDEIAFGVDITREDVVAVFEMLATHFYERRGFDAHFYMEKAGVTFDDFMEIFWATLLLPENREQSYNRHGRLWLAHYSYDMLFWLRREVAHYTGEEFLWLRRRGLYAEILRHLHSWTVVTTIRQQVTSIESTIFPDMPVFYSFINNPELGEVLAHLSKYDENTLLEMFSFQSPYSFVAFVADDNPPQGVLYLDKLLGGFFSDNREHIENFFEEQLREAERLYEERRIFAEYLRILGDLFTWAYYSHGDLFVPVESYHSGREDLEQRFSHRVAEQVLKAISFEYYAYRYRLNMHFVNHGDLPVTIVYFIDSFYGKSAMYTLELSAGDRLSKQVELSDYFSPCGLLFWEVFFLSPYDLPIDVHFAYRLTEFSRGHYTHGAYF